MITAQDLTPTVMMTAQDRAPTGGDAGGEGAGETAMAGALADFLRRWPAYASTAVLDGMRAKDYARLDAADHVYLDYTGGGLYAESQLAGHRDLLAGGMFGNPHSQNVPSLEMAAQVEATRRRSWSSSGHHRRSMRSSSPRTPPARCGWSASPIRSGRAAGTC